MDLLVLNFLNGISFGMVLFLLAAGLSLTYGVMGVLNLAHGSLYMVGAFVGFFVLSGGHGFWLAALLGGIAAGLGGLVLEKVFLSRLHNLRGAQATLTVGIVYILGNLCLWIFGPQNRLAAPPLWFTFSVHIGNYTFPVYRLVLIIIGTGFFIGLWLLLTKTRIGAIIRAGMDDKEMIMGLGSNYELVSTAVFSLGAFASGFAGAIALPMIGVAPYISWDIFLYALIVVVVGGLGSLQGSLIGALAIGIIDTFSRSLFSDFSMFILYAVLVITLLIKPSGILGRKTT